MKSILIREIIGSGDMFTYREDNMVSAIAKVNELAKDYIYMNSVFGNDHFIINYRLAEGSGVNVTYVGISDEL